MWGNDYEEPSRKASGAWGRITCLQQPWESSLKPPFAGTTEPAVRACRAQSCSLPPGTWKPLKPTWTEGPGCKISLWAPQRKGLLWAASTGVHPLHQLKLCHRCKILSLRRNCQLKQEIHPTSLCRPHKCWFDSFTSFHKPIVAVPSFWQEDFRTDKSF